MESIRLAMDNVRRANNLGLQLVNVRDTSQHLLKTAIPHDQGGTISFMAYQKWYGTSNDELSSLINNNCFIGDIQERKIIGIVQSYGCGKTKTVLMLTQTQKPYIVLPWRPTFREELITFLKDEQEKEFYSLPTVDIDLQTIEKFSQFCFRLVNFIFLSFLAVLDECASCGIVNLSNKEDRFFLALLLLQGNKALKNRLLSWCKNNRKLVDSEAEFNKLRTELEFRGRPFRIVFLIDEIHLLFGLNRGYCLHMTSGMQPTVEEWTREWKNGIQASKHRSCTDLFYQVRWWMLQALQTADPACAFVMCSTLFKTWRQLEVDNSPLSRETIRKFYDMHHFTAEGVKLAIQDMFNLQDSFFENLEIRRQLSYWDRPYYLMELLKCLAQSFLNVDLSTEAAIYEWFNSSVYSSLKTCKSVANDKMSNLLNQNPSLDTYTAMSIFKFLYTAKKVCGGTLNLASSGEEGVNMIADIIQAGVARLERDETRFRIADHIFLEVLEDFANNNGSDIVLATLTEHKCTHDALVAQDQSGKGFMLERIFARILQLNTLLIHPDYIVQAATAGTHLELRCPIDSELLVQIAKGQNFVIAFPTTRAGPDLWGYMSVPGDRAPPLVVGAQLKFERGKYGWKKFITALESLNPSLMYSSANQQEQTTWRAFLPEFKFMNYKRVVFAAEGFSPKVYYAVLEYNIKYPTTSIKLLSLSDLQPCLGPLYQSWIPQNWIGRTAPNSPMLLHSDWLAKTPSAHSRYTVPMLSELCKLRRIPLYNANKKKKKDELIRDLNQFSIDNFLKPLTVNSLVNTI